MWFFVLSRLTEPFISFHFVSFKYLVCNSTAWNAQFVFFPLLLAAVLFVCHLAYQRPEDSENSSTSTNKRMIVTNENARISGSVKNCMQQSFECVVITQTNYISSKFMVFILEIRRKMVRIFGNRIGIGFLVFPFDFVLLCSMFMFSLCVWVDVFVLVARLRSLMFISRSGCAIMKQADLSHGTDLNYAKRKWFYLIASIFFIEGFVLYSMYWCVHTDPHRERVDKKPIRTQVSFHTEWNDYFPYSSPSVDSIWFAVLCMSNMRSSAISATSNQIRCESERMDENE